MATKQKFLKFFNVYYILVLFLGLDSLYNHFSNPIKVSQAYFMRFNLITYLMFFISIIIVLLSIISIRISLKYKLKRITLIYPIYNIIFFVVWLTLIPILIYLYYIHSPVEVSLSLIDNISRYDYFSYFFDIIFSVYMLVKVNKSLQIFKNPIS